MTMNYRKQVTDSSQVAMAVCAVVYAYHGAAELLETIKEKRRDQEQQASQDSEEKRLLDSLLSGESRISDRYMQDLKQLEERAWFGDGRFENGT